MKKRAMQKPQITPGASSGFSVYLVISISQIQVSGGRCLADVPL